MAVCPFNTEFGKAQSNINLGDRTKIAIAAHVEPAGAVHLFFAGPGALAGLIGHRWNALPPATVYEHMGGAGYEATLRIES